MSSIVELKKDIINNNLKRFYILLGEEIGLMNIYINQINQEVVRENSVASVWTKLVQRSIVKNEKVYVIRDDKDFISNEARWKKLNEVRYGTLILLITKIDKRSKFLKAYPEHVIEFEKMTPAQLSKHFSSKYQVAKPLLEKVIQLCENDYSRIDNELDKLSRVPNVSMEHVELLVHTQKEFDVFGTVDSVISYRVEEALYKVDTMFARGESPLGFLTMLYNQFVAAAKMLGTKDPKESTIHVKQFIINKLKYNFNYSIDAAFTGMDVLADTIEGIKQGKYTEKYGTYLALFTIFSLE